MKKIFTILFSTALFSSAFAQTNRHDRKDNDNTQPWNAGAGQQVYKQDRDHDDDHDNRQSNGVYNNTPVYQNNPNVQRDRDRDGDRYGNRQSNGVYNNTPVYQNNPNVQRDRDRDGDRYGNSNSVYRNNSYSTVQRDQQVQRISSQYDYRIQQVAYDRSLSRNQKQYYIQQLQAQKAQQINSIYAQYNNSYSNNNRYRRY